MSPITPRSTLQLVAVALVALAGGAMVCEGCGSGSGESGGASGGDAGASEGGRPRDGGVADHELPEAALVDTGSGPDADDAAPVCPPPTSKGAACSACVASNCEAAWCSCKSDPMGIDDAGNSGCLGYVVCAENCVASDAGSPTACLQQICSRPLLTPIEKSEGQNLIDCLVSYCDTECVE